MAFYKQPLCLFGFDERASNSGKSKTVCYSTGEVLALHTCEYIQKRSGERLTHCEYNGGRGPEGVKG